MIKEISFRSISFAFANFSSGFGVFFVSSTKTKKTTETLLLKFLYSYSFVVLFFSVEEEVI